MREADLLSVWLLFLVKQQKVLTFPKHCCGTSVINVTSNYREAVPSDNRLDSVSRLSD